MAKKGKFQQPRTKTAVKPKKKPLILPILGGTLVLAAVALLLWGNSLMDGKTVYPNVWVAGVDVGGMTASEAQQTVEQAVADRYLSQTLEVRLPDRSIFFDPEQTNVVLDGQLAIAEAMAFGRSDGPFRSVIQYCKSRRQTHEMELQTALQLDTAYLESLIYQTATEVKTAPVNSSMAMDAGMTKVTITVGVPGRVLDTQRLYSAVYNAFQTGELSPMNWEYDAVPYEEVDLASLHEKLGSRTTDAYYDEQARKIVPGVNGHTFDLEAEQKHLESARHGSTLVIHLEEQQPALTTEKLTGQMFGKKLEQRSSVYVNNPKRTENLRLACEAINGTILGPGDVFSFNEVVGERTEEKGYQPATIYGGEGESIDGVGGGVCQVASTIYYAALYMDLPTVMREPHMYVVTYVPAGCDATIYWGSGLDYKFKNNRENPIKIQANINDGKCNITFWGVEESDNYVKLSDPVTLETWTDPDEEILDETKPVGFKEQKQTSYTGAKVVVTKTVYDGNGEVLREEKLYSTYKSRPNIYIVGPSEELPPEEIPDEIPEEDFWEEDIYEGGL